MSRGPVIVAIQKSGAGVQLIWQAGTLLSAPSVTGPWNPVNAAKAPYYQVTPGTTNGFYRVQL